MSGSNTPYIIAEMACTHEGKVDLAHKLVDIAANSGTDAIQLQLFSVRRLISPFHPGYEDGLKLEISPMAWREIISHAQERNLDVWANVFDEESLSLAMQADVHALKLHSSDLSNPRMLEAVSETGKPISIAVGGSTLDEISQAVSYLRKKGIQDLVLMHGYQGYPTLPADAHLRYITTLQQLFNCPIGYQDHTDGASELALILPLVAIGYGATILEKHYTDDRSRKGIDYEAALDPDDLARFVTLVKQVTLASGDGVIQPMSKAELKYRQTMKKTIVAARQIAAGELISPDMVMFMRSEPGLLPTELDKLVGMRVQQPIPQYATIKLDNLVPVAERNGSGEF